MSTQWNGSELLGVPMSGKHHKSANLCLKNQGLIDISNVFSSHKGKANNVTNKAPTSQLMSANLESKPSSKNADYPEPEFFTEEYNSFDDYFENVIPEKYRFSKKDLLQLTNFWRLRKPVDTDDDLEQIGVQQIPISLEVLAMPVHDDDISVLEPLIGTR